MNRIPEYKKILTTDFGATWGSDDFGDIYELPDGTRKCVRDMDYLGVVPNSAAIKRYLYPEETTEQKLARIKAELTEIHKNTNEGPRLIAEMMKDLPNPRGPHANNGAMSHNLG